MQHPLGLVLADAPSSAHSVTKVFSVLKLGGDFLPGIGRKNRHVAVGRLPTSLPGGHSLRQPGDPRGWPGKTVNP